MATLDVEAAIYGYLQAQAGFTSVFSTRLYPDQARQGAAMPYCVFQVASITPSHHFTAAAGLTEKRVIFWVYDNDSVGRAAGYEALRAEVDGYPQKVITVGADTLDVRSMRIEGGDYDYIPPQTGNDIGTYVARLDVMIWHAESVPTF